MEPLIIEDVQQEKTIGMWGSAKRRKVFFVLGVMAALLVISVIFITLYVSEERRCTPCDAQKGTLDTVNKTIEALSKSVDTLDKNIERKLDLVNKSNAGLFVQFQEKLDTVDKTKEALSRNLESLDKNIGRKLDLVNKSNTELALQVIPGMSQRITALENQEKLDAVNKTMETLSISLESLDKNIVRKLNLVNKSNTELSLRVIPGMSQRITALENQGTLDTVNKTIAVLSKSVDTLDKNIERKLDLVNKSNADLFVQFQEKLEAMNKTIEALSKSLESLDTKLGRELYLANKSNADLSQMITALETQVAAHYALLFPRKGITDYVITRGMPSLKAVTVCVWMKTTDTGNDGALLSYAVSGSNNELLLSDYRNFYLVVSSSGSSGRSASANDGKWHHICATWENTAGSWKLFKDGMAVASDKGLATGQEIRGGGGLVLGQDQDSVGGGFDLADSFIGEMTGVNIWDHVITDQEIARMSRSCLTGVGNVYQWRDFKAHLKGSVQIIKPSC